MLQTVDQASYTTGVEDSSRRRSTFYVPLNASNEELSGNAKSEEETKKASDQVYNPDLSACSFDWSMNDSMDTSELLVSNESKYSGHSDSNKLKRYGIVLNGSVNIDDSNLEVHANHRHLKLHSSKSNITSSTPIKLTKSKSRSSIEDQLAEPTEPLPPTIMSPIKEKSKTLPVKDSLLLSTFPPKTSFILKSTPKMSSSLNYSSLSDTTGGNAEPRATSSPKKSLSFIRRAHSTKLSRSNSLLKTLTTKCVEQSNENLQINVYELLMDRLETYIKSEKCDELMKEFFFKESLDSSSSDCGSSDKDCNNKNDKILTTKKDKEDDDDVHSGKYISYMYNYDCLEICRVGSFDIIICL